MTEKEKDALLDAIAELELEMYLSTPAGSGDARFQSKPEIFKLTRRMAHSAHGNRFLQSYLNDLRDAKSKGRNLVREKYDNLANLSTPDALLEEIAVAEMDFLNQAAELYPDIIRHKATEDYKSYLQSELRTMSPESLNLYAEEIRNAKAEGYNPALERHNWLAARLGKPLLGAPEK